MIKPLSLFSFLLFVFTALSPSGSDNPAYILYDSEGKQVSFEELIDRSIEADIIFFGEQHNDPIGHWLQLELIQVLSADSSKSTILGMEMFEADQQILIDEYFNDQISQASFENEARLWDNYSTDYKPLVEFSKQNEIPLVATNIPRRYASSVYYSGLSGLDSLSANAKEWMVPLPFEVDTTLESYRDMAQIAQGHGGENLIYSQAIKDATMAHFILSNLDESHRMIHLNGSYHSNNDEGIVWYIRQENEDLKILTINTISADDVQTVERDRLQSADITLAVPSTMTKTY